MKLLNLKLIIVLSCLASSVYWVRPAEKESQQEQASSSSSSSSDKPVTPQQKIFMQGLRKWWGDQKFREKFKSFVSSVNSGFYRGVGVAGKGLGYVRDELATTGQGFGALWQLLVEKWKAQKAPSKPAELSPLVLAQEGSIQLGQIFEYVTGMREGEGISLTFEEQYGLFFITNQATRKRFCCGRIEYKTLGKLKSEQFSIANGGQPSFKVICYTGQDKSRFSEADVCALQADPKNADAVFQLASRMHGLEGGSVYGGENTEKDLGFNRMLQGPTQGEYASFSAAPGTIYKMYRFEQINMLSGTPFEGLINPEASGGGMPSINAIVGVSDIPENWTDKLRIYFHENIDVVAGEIIDQGGRRVVTGQKIHQIPVAAFDWRIFNDDVFQHSDSQIGRLSDPDRTKLRKITGQMLNAFYEGTLLSAVSKGKHKIFLTAVGGGAFMNDLDLVTAAIANANIRDIIIKYGLDVKLVIHVKPELAEMWKKCMDEFWTNKGLDYEFKTI